MNTKKQTLALRQSMMNELVKESVAELLNNQLDERGLPVFGIIETVDENGNLVKAYKRENLFNAEDYREAALYQAKLANNHKILADYYMAELEKQYPNFNKA